MNKLVYMNSFFENHSSSFCSAVGKKRSFEGEMENTNSGRENPI
jgi:hypothetical protein